MRSLPRAVATTYGSRFIRVSDGSGPGGLAIYNFNVPTRADYIVWGRRTSTAPDHDSFRVMFDADSDNDDWVWQTQAGNGWVWNMVNSAGRGVLHVMLDPGSHWMAVKQNETGTALDRIFISKQPVFRPGTRRARADCGGTLSTASSGMVRATGTTGVAASL